VARVLEEELRQALAELSRDGVPVQEVIRGHPWLGHLLLSRDGVPVQEVT